MGKSIDSEKLIFLDSGQYLGDTNFDARDCDLIFKIDYSFNAYLDDLPGNSPTAFILSNEGVAYVDRDSNECIIIERNDEEFMLSNLYQFAVANNISNDQAMLLSGSNLSTVKDLTKFDVNSRSQTPKQFRDNIRKMIPEIEIWSCIGVRQLDMSSCTIDAMVTIKDALRMSPKLSDIAAGRFIHRIQDVNLFRLPEYLLKTAQISSFVTEESLANFDIIMHTHHNKDDKGNKTGTTRVLTLQEFREQHNIQSRNSRGIQKKFNTYTIQKGKKIAKLLQQRWEDKNIRQDSLNTVNFNVRVSNHVFFANKTHRDFLSKQKARDTLANKQIYIKDIVMRTHPKMAITYDNCLGEVSESGMYQHSVNQRLIDHIKSLFIIASSEHRINYCEQDRQGKYIIKAGMENHITRLSTCEFSLYTESPIPLNEFHELIAKIENIATDLEENTHVLLSSFAVNDGNFLQNMVIFVEGGSNPILHVFAKNQFSLSDVDYRCKFLPFGQHDSNDHSIHAAIVATDADCISPNVSSSSVFEITTFGGACFTQAIDICIDHAYGHSSKIIEKRITEKSAANEVLPEQIEHCITSCGVNISAENTLSEKVLHIDPLVSFAEENKRLLNPATEKIFNQTIPSEYEYTTLYFDRNYGGYTLINPIFGPFPYLIETLQERPATRYKPELKKVVEIHNKHAYKNQIISQGHPTKKAAAEYLLQNLNATQDAMLAKCKSGLYEKTFNTSSHKQKMAARSLIVINFKFINNILIRNDIENGIQFVKTWVDDLEMKLLDLNPAPTKSELINELLTDLGTFNESLQEIYTDFADDSLPYSAYLHLK